MLRRLNIDKNLHVLIVEDKEKKVFLAHCLDMDIVGQGKTEKEATLELVDLIKTQMEFCLKEDTLDTLFRSAPKEYWDMFYRSQAARVVNELSLHKREIIEKLTHHLEFAYA